jgi:type I restriction enzyme M protein
MDLRRMNENISEDKTVYFTDEQINKVKNIFHSWQSPDYKETYKDVPEFSKSIDLETISKEENDFSLVPSKYIKFIDRDLDINFDKEMTRIQKQMKVLLKEEKETHQMLRDAFEGIGYDVE